MMRLTQRGTYTRLLLAIVLTLTLEPLLIHHFGALRWIGLAFVVLVLAAALDAMRANRRTRAMMWVVGVFAMLVAWVAFGVREAGKADQAWWVEPLVGGIEHASLVLFLGMVAWLLIRAAVAPGRITGERIVAAICAYLLLGLLWAQAYQFVNSVYGQAIGGAFGGSTQEYVYFSFVTLTTLGYGDVLPVHPAARVLAFLEAVTGVLYLATLVARLVALHIVHEAEARDDESSA